MCMKRCLTSLTLILLGLLRSHASLLVSDAFDYPNGNLSGAAGSPWLAHSSTGLVAVAVNTGRAIVNGGTGAREDVSRVIPGVGVQTWSGPPDALPRPEGMGLLKFVDLRK